MNRYIVIGSTGDGFVVAEWQDAGGPGPPRNDSELIEARQV